MNTPYVLPTAVLTLDAALFAKLNKALAWLDEAPVDLPDSVHEQTVEWMVDMLAEAGHTGFGAPYWVIDPAGGPAVLCIASESADVCVEYLVVSAA